MAYSPCERCGERPERRHSVCSPSGYVLECRCGTEPWVKRTVYAKQLKPAKRENSRA